MEEKPVSYFICRKVAIITISQVINPYLCFIYLVTFHIMKDNKPNTMWNSLIESTEESGDEIAIFLDGSNFLNNIWFLECCGFMNTWADIILTDWIQKIILYHYIIGLKHTKKHMLEEEHYCFKLHMIIWWTPLVLEMNFWL